MEAQKRASEVGGGAAAVVAEPGDVEAEEAFDRLLERVRDQERYRWLEQKMERWVGEYSVPQLVEILGAQPTSRGQHERALVALSLSDGVRALPALEALSMEGRTASFRRLYQICVEQARRRALLDARLAPTPA